MAKHPNYPDSQLLVYIPKDERVQWKHLGDSFTAESFDWELVKAIDLRYKCLPDAQATCGKILSHCNDQINLFRERIGLRLCIFKIGVTSNPINRYLMYRDQGFHSMWVLAVSPSVDLIHMLEAGLVMAFYKHVGCRNQKGTGGEGALNKKDRAPPPYFLYVTGGRADQRRRVG